MRKGWIGCLVIADINYYLSFPCGSVVKNPPADAEDTDLIPSSERSLGEGNGNPLQCSCLAWEIPWTEEHGGLQTPGCRIKQDLVTQQQQTVLYVMDKQQSPTV